MDQNRTFSLPQSWLRHKRQSAREQRRREKKENEEKNKSNAKEVSSADIHRLEFLTSMKTNHKTMLSIAWLTKRTGEAFFTPVGSLTHPKSIILSLLCLPIFRFARCLMKCCVCEISKLFTAQ